jgi:hypothetical protein
MCDVGGPPNLGDGGRQPGERPRTTRILMLVASHTGVAVVAATAATGSVNTAFVSGMATVAVVFTLRSLNF